MVQPDPAPPALVPVGVEALRVVETPISVEEAPPTSVEAVETSVAVASGSEVSVTVALGRAVAAPEASGNAVSTSVDEERVEFAPAAVASVLAVATSCNKCQWQ